MHFYQNNTMNQLKKLLFLFLIPFMAGCASIVSKSNWPFSVDSNPSGARVSITNRKGVEVFKGRTPAAMRLKSGSAFFTKESYTILLSMPGYETRKINVECKLNGWYFGNVVFGGLIGLLIVDPATGAMYRLDSTGVSEDLTPSTSTSSTLKIMDKNEIPEGWEKRLVRIDGK
jgi:hypothetical protein